MSDGVHPELALDDQRVDVRIDNHDDTHRAKHRRERRVKASRGAELTLEW